MKKLIAALAFLLVSMSVISANVISVNAEEEVEVTVTAGLIVKGMDIEEGSDYSYDWELDYNPVLTILSDKHMTISGTGENGVRIWVTSPDGANITFENLNISFAHMTLDGTGKAYSHPPFGIDSGAGSVTITLVENNKLEAGGGSAGLQNNSVPLTIKGDGKLEAYGWWGGAGIGGGKGQDGENITIEGGTIIAQGISGAGIGGGEDGIGYNIKINGGTVTATGWCDKGKEITFELPYSIGGGAGIGGGKSMSKKCSGSYIEINGGDVTAIGYGGGAGIGGGDGGDGEYITITDGDVRAGSMTLNGKDGFAAYAGMHDGAAGIGGGDGGNGENITITGGNITAIAWDHPGGTVVYGKGAGIGGGSVTGSAGVGYNEQFKCEGGGSGNNITISGNANIILAQGGSGGGAGIGGGYGGTSTTIIISEDANIQNALSSGGGAGIGGGAKCRADYGYVYVGGNATDIQISGSGTINATGGGAGIGGGSGGSGEGIRISGGVTVVAYGGESSAGIGGGGTGGDGKDGEGIDIKIDNKGGMVKAYGGSTGAGIGGGYGCDGDKITIESGTVIAQGGGAGIGGGNGNPSKSGKGSNITINGGEITATGGGACAGIGGGNYAIGSNIEINGGKIKATGDSGGAGIGGGSGSRDESTITINDCIFIEAEAINGGGAGIGGGSYSSAKITIVDGTSIKATGASGAAGIGGGSASNGTVVISGGKIEAQGGSNGTGIGGGQGGSGTVTISGGKIEAIGDTGAGIGGANSNSAENVITISGGDVKATTTDIGIGIGNIYGGKVTVTISGEDTVVKAEGTLAAIGSTNMANGSSIEIAGGTVTATGTGDRNAMGIGGTNVTIDGENTSVTAAGIGSGAGITGSNIAINDGKVTAEGGSDGGTGIGGADSTVNIKGEGSTSYPWVYTNEITSSNNDGYLAIVLDVAGTNGTVYGGEVILTEEYRFDTGGRLTVKGGTTFRTENRLILDNNSVLYLEAGAKLDKYNKINIISGEIQHEDQSEYVEDSSGKMVCNICGKEEPHNWGTAWTQGTSHHWHECTPGKDCAVNSFDIKECNIKDSSKKDGYEAHIYDFDNPTDKGDGRLYYRCTVCGYEYSVEIPVIHLIKVDGTTGDSLEGARFGIYSNEQCTNTDLITTRTMAMDADNNATISYAALPGRTYYIRETDAPDGYRISDKVYKAVVGADGKITYSIVGSADTSENIPVCKNYDINAIIPDPAKIMKVDGETGTPLAGAWFGIYSDAGCTNLITTGTTAIGADNKAVVSFDTELNRTYYIKETKVPDGYKVSDEVYRAVVDADGKVTYSVVGSETTLQEVPVCRNYAVKVTISDPVKIIKVDGETGAPLAGARFGIYSDAECTSLITTGTTAIGADNKAVVSFDTEPNRTYYIKETKAPDGYKISDEVFKAVVDATGKVTYSVVGSTDTAEDIPVCRNYAVKVTISNPAKIMKVDGETGAPLAGARFGLYSDAECTVLITTGNTVIGADNKAVVTFATEPNRVYYIRENAAPDGYKVSDVVYKAVVDANGKVTYGVAGSQTTSETVPVCKNEKTADDDTSVPEDAPEDEAHNPKTGDPGGYGTVGIAILSGMICAMSLVEGAYRRKRKNIDDNGIDF